MRTEAPGKDANEVINAQDKHLKDAVAGGDATPRAGVEGHEGSLEAARRAAMGWYKQVKRDFAALPED